MLQYYLGVYGVIVCVIGYIYALVEWHLRNRRYTMAIEHQPIENNPQTIRSVCSNSSERSCQPDATEEKKSHEHEDIEAVVSNIGETDKNKEQVNVSPMEKASETSADQHKSWNERRTERRKRYKEEKSHSRILAANMELLTPVEEAMTFSEDDCKPDDLQDISQYLSLENTKFQTFEEMMAAHQLCSRRESVQVTDLDERLQVASSCTTEVSGLY
ncbi:hypothetical protein EG68_11580 [Paragonimus skrjabini miyazakii]|uniref:Transmembrane protein n=1 Tax=Paragonimus skrjabini miyazakii TaxID=59628 RepID=A0A8S9YLA6_9TREM|nr:hypothetical protein EG68_11580 [Paragonimus skrjabini miyazakii]